MDCSQSGCGSDCQKTVVVEAPDVIAAAEKLACLLTDLPEFQQLVCQARAVRLDEEVASLLNQMNGQGDPTQVQAETPSTESLENQLEGLSIVKQYRSAEEAARQIFGAVEAAISGAAGVAFAEHAKPSACG